MVDEGLVVVVVNRKVECKQIWIGVWGWFGCVT